MRLHRLEVCAFGPYADAQTVDFDHLGEAGIFLLTGPTGAGKTSVLDAVCYALFGAVPGARQAARRLRSDHAAPGDRTGVRLDLTVRGRRLRITREPEQERPKHRGPGTTVEKARGSLEEWDGTAWTTLSTRLDEIGHEIEALLGMSREQFCQVVLLPQGNFAAFLSADAERRRELLQRLFDTDRFAAVEQWLADRRVETDRRRRAAVDAVEETVDRMAEAAGVESRPDDVDLAVWCTDVVDQAAKRLTVADELVAGAKVAQQRAKMRHDTARDVAMRQAAHMEAVRRREALDEARADLLLAEVELAAARRAAAVLPLLQMVAAADTALQQTRTAGNSARASVRERTAGTPDGTLADAELTILRARATQLRDEVARLGELLPVAAEVVSLRRAIDEHRAAATAAADRARRHDEWLSAWPTRRQELGSRREEQQRLATLLDSRVEEVQRRDAVVRAAAERDRLTAEQVRAAEAVMAAVDRAQAARSHWLDLREQRLRGLAAELAAELRPGDPCPVCGGRDHPAPAAPDSTAVTADDEAAAQRQYEHAEDVRRTTERSLEQVERDLVRATTAAGGRAPLADLVAAATAARDACSQSAAASRVSAELTAALEALDLERATHEDGRERARRLERDQAKDAAHAARQLETATRRLDEARGTDTDVESRLHRLTALLSAVEALVDALGDEQRATTAHAEAEIRATAHAQRAGFPSCDAAAAAARPPADVAALDSRLRAFAREEAVVAEQLGSAELVAAAALPAADVESALVALDEADRAAAASSAEQGAARQADAAVRRLAEQLQQRLRALRPLEEHWRTVNALSRLTEGSGTDNELRMRLSSYVLAARLEQVAAAASERLLVMSAGRYTLVHTDEREGNRRSGLGLAVIDGWTGQQRPTSTLSGGETFFASLALALGLADVVSAEAGGTTLETLFVDEGFGSLDDDTLDEVMTVLDGLRSGGRVVGVVSHVADLRQRIPVQLRVTKTANGSALDLT